MGMEKGPHKLPQVSFISQLPPEILSEIFLDCIPHEQFPVACRTQAPLLLTQVSASWRALALASPDLWTALHINYKDPVEDIPATDLWLSRSGSKPLTLSIAIDFGEQPQQEIIDAICRHSTRWKHIRFDFRHLLCPQMYDLGLAQDQIPELCTFEFHARDISNTNVFPITRLLHSAPKLRELTWVDDLADTDTLLGLPLRRLTRLSLEMDHGTLDYLQVLNECSNLEHIRITRPSATIPQTRPPLFLPKLTSLNISSDLTDIFDHLVLPALKEVRIYAESDKQAQSHALGHDPEPSSYSQMTHPGPAHVHPSQSSPSSSVGGWEPVAFLSLIDRSACAISSLSVTAPITEHTLLTCLRRVSDSLVKLSIEGIGVGDTLIASLTRPPTQKCVGIHGGAGISENKGWGDGDVLCPALEEINLDTRVACAQGALVAMVDSRLVRSSSGINGQEIRGSISRVRVVDGHRDLEKLRDLEACSRRQADASLRTRATFTVDVIPKKPKRTQTRNFFFRRKLCASR